LGLKLLADLTEAFIRIVLTGTDVEGHADDEPDRPDQEQGGYDGCEDGKSRHFVFSLDKWKSGSDARSLPDSGNSWI